MGSQVYQIRWGIEIWGRERGYIRGHFYEERHHQFVGMAGHGTPFAKMKGLKISQPQSVARIDHTSFLCERSLLPLSLSLSLSLVLAQPRASLLLPTPSIYPFEHPSLTDRRNAPFFNLPHLRFGRACFLVAPASGLETHRLRDSCENSVKKLASSPTTSTGSDRPR